jgi:GR25 family glycosyltransferase involved in LPS biosynthesis
MVRMKFYLISLDESPKEKLKYLAEFGIYPELIKGVDGKKVSKYETKEAVSAFYYEFGPKSAIGCAIANMNVYKKIVEGDDEYSVIFEDDVVLRDANATNTIEKIVKEAPRDFDIIYLGCFDSEFFKNVMGLLAMTSKEERISENLVRPAIALGTHAYVVSKQGAAKLLKELYGKVHNHIDYCIQYLYKSGKLNNYEMTPRIAFQTSTDTGVSSMITSTTCHPKIVSKYLSSIYVDEMVKASYVATLSVGRLGDIPITVSSIIILLLGVILALQKVSIENITLLFWILSIPDLIDLANLRQIMFHYTLFIMPSLILGHKKENM